MCNLETANQRRNKLTELTIKRSKKGSSYQNEPTGFSLKMLHTFRILTREKYRHGTLRLCMEWPTQCFMKMLYEHYFCYTFSSALGDKRDHDGNEKKKNAQLLINVNANSVVIGDHATVRMSPNGGIS